MSGQGGQGQLAFVLGWEGGRVDRELKRARNNVWEGTCALKLARVAWACPEASRLAPSVMFLEQALQVTLAMLINGEQGRLFDHSARCGKCRWVLFTSRAAYNYALGPGLRILLASGWRPDEDQ